MSHPQSTAAAQPESQPPEDDFTLEPPPPVAPVPPSAAGGRVRLKPDEVSRLDAQVREFIDQVAAHDVHAPEFQSAVERVHAMGNKEIEASASVSNRLLDRPLKAMQSSLFDQGSQIGQGLVDLRRDRKSVV